MDVIIYLLAIPVYLSGLLLWPIRRWLSRKRKVRGKALWVVFLLQIPAPPLFIYLDTFYYKFWDAWYGWEIIWIEFNILFTIIGVVAWICDAIYERAMNANNVGDAVEQSG
jgi:hypothetical protein